MSTPVPVDRLTFTDLGSVAAVGDWSGDCMSLSLAQGIEVFPFGIAFGLNVMANHSICVATRIDCRRARSGNTAPCDGRKYGFESRRVHAQILGAQVLWELKQG